MAHKVSDDIAKELAPTGELRAAINLGNFLLVTGRSPSGDPVGVAPDIARAVADSIGVPIRYVTYDKPSQLANAATDNAWDIGLIGAEPERARHIAFTDAYAEIEATYLVPASSDLHTPDDVDKPGRRIAVAERTAYGLWLDRHVKQAELVRSDSMESAFQQFVDQKLDALAGLRSRLLQDAERLPGSKVMADRFTAVQQALGTPIANRRAHEFLIAFVKQAKASNRVDDLIAKHGVKGLSAAR